VTGAPNDGVLEGRELPLLAANWRNELVRFSNTFLRPWHRSSQSPYLLAEGATEFSGAGSARNSVAAGTGVAAAEVADAGLATAGVGTADVADEDIVAGAVWDSGVGTEAESECGCAAGGFADTDSSNDCDAGFGFRARLTEEFSQKEILAVPSGCRTVCKCNGHCPR